MWSSLFYIIIIYPCFVVSISRIYIGPEIYYRRYHEQIIGDGKSDEYGYMYGFRSGYEACFFPLYIHLMGDLSYGRTTYDGTQLYFEEGILVPCISHTDNRIWDLEGNIGYVFARKKESTLTFIPIIGPGYHAWFREGEKEDDYDEKYSWYYFLVGLKFDSFFYSSYRLGLSLKGQYTQNGYVEIIRLFAEDLTLSLNNDWQYSADLYASYFLNKTDVKLTLFYKNQDIGSSEQIETEGFKITTPLSKSNLIGICFELGYRF